MAENVKKAQRDLKEAVDLLWDTPSVMARFEGTGTISADGNTITGYFLDVNNDEHWNYSFTRYAPPAP